MQRLGGGNPKLSTNEAAIGADADALLENVTYKARDPSSNPGRKEKVMSCVVWPELLLLLSSPNFICILSSTHQLQAENLLKDRKRVKMLCRNPCTISTISRSASQPLRFSTFTRFHQKYESSVETPVQAQNNDNVTPSAVRPEADASTMETPVQKQRREALAPPTGQTREKSYVVPGLLAGIVGIVPLVYYYYQYRREHMDNKRANLLEQQRQKYANGG